MKATRGKLFQNGGSEECPFAPQGEVLVRRKGRRVILEASDEWSEAFRGCLGAWRGRIPRPKQKRVRDLRDSSA
jgi:hypothetical protein